ncbi:MAG: hypothetical protein ABIQ40_03830 [Bacteroidia bacterium]
MNKKIIIGSLMIVGSIALKAQDKILQNTELDSAAHSFYSQKYSPQLFLGSITENGLSNSLLLDITKEEIKLNGLVYGTKESKNIGSISITGSNENNTAGIFSENKIEPKFSGTFSNSYTFKNWISFKPDSNVAAEKVYDFQSLNTTKDSLLRIRNNFISFTGGVKVEGAMYYLIDTLKPIANMIRKEKYSGGEFFFQANWLVYNYKSKNLWSHSMRLSYGIVNNVEDLVEFTIAENYIYSNPSKKNDFERKTTGYFDTYVLQNRSVINYEVGFYPLNEYNRVGFLFGPDFYYNSKAKNYMRFNAGINFPVSTKEKTLFFVAAILRTTDPFNMTETKEFEVKKTFSVLLRIGVPLEFKYLKK